MDTRQQLELIRTRMPVTYGIIQEQAKVLGPVVFVLVRQALRGEANKFWACEAGHVVGTPFNNCEASRDVACLMVRFGPKAVVMWAESAASGAAHAH